MSSYLFTYGLLTPDCKSEVEKQLKAKAKVLCRGKMKGLLFDCGDYPAAITDEDNASWINGWLYEVLEEDNLFKVLDEFEGDEYTRTKREIITETDTKRTAWVYLYNRPTKNLKRILSGDYFADSWLNE